MCSHPQKLLAFLMASVFSIRNARIILAFQVLFCGSLTVCITAAGVIARNELIRVHEKVVSAGGFFALGFFSPGNSSNRYLGIWFEYQGHKVIWVANRDTPLTDSSGILKFDSSGNLGIFDGSGKMLWSTNISTPANVSHAELLDSGNLVLREVDSYRGLWQSFDHPTNAFMPNMELGVNLRTNQRRVITSWKSDSNPSIGSFSSGIDSNLFSQLFVWNGSIPHWRSGPWDGQVFLGIPEMNRRSYVNGFDVFRDKDQRTVYISYSYSNNSHNLAFIIDVSGRIQYMGWNEKKEAWGIVWAAPDNECKLL